MGTKTLYLPESARDYAQPSAPDSEVSRENREMLEQLESEVGALAYWTRELQQIDPHLRVVMAKQTVTVEGMKPGYYHIIRYTGPNSPVYIKPVENPDGTWRDLDSYVLALVQDEDMWNDRLQRDKQKLRARAEEERLRQKDRERQDRVDHFNDRVKHAFNTQISVAKEVH